MKTLSSLFKVLSAACLAMTAWTNANSGELPAPPGMVWKASIKSETLDYQYQAAANGKDNSLWLVAGARPKGQLSGPQSFLLFHLDGNGKIQTEVPFDSFLKRAHQTTKLSAICCMAVLRNGDLAVLGASEAVGSLAIILKNGANGPVIVQPVYAAQRDQIFRKIFPLENRGSFIIGRSGRNAYITNLDDSAKFAGGKEYANEDLAIFLDGVAYGNDEAVLLGSSQAGDIWIGRLDSDQKVVAKNHFHGRDASITRADNGIIAVIDDQGPAGLDIWVRKLTPELTELWGTHIISDAGPLPFKVAGLPDGGAMIAGSRHNLVWLARIDPDGATKWTYAPAYDPKTQPFLRNVDLVRSGDGVLLVSTVLKLVGEDTQMEQRQSIEILRLSGK